MDVLALTLGHNSSAVFIQDGHILAGYEEERFTQQKSDSRFPARSIEEIKRRFNVSPSVKVCVSHWFPDGAIEDETKYWSLSALKSWFPSCEVLSLNKNLSHHDAHAYSAAVFAGKEFTENTGIYVVDGFGTKAEHTSIYQYNGYKPTLTKRYYGFKHSIGLFYQYATAFCGMKMHQDEYKMLAYETHVTEVVDVHELERINDYVDAFSEESFSACYKGSGKRSLSTLPIARDGIEHKIQVFYDKFKSTGSEREMRILVSYFAQRHTENYVRYLYRQYPFDNLIVVGGVFYNVKINSLLCDLVLGKFCAMPLAGDQGAGLGVYQNYFGDLRWPNHLFWGHRKVDPLPLNDETGLEFVPRRQMEEVILEKLGVFGMVNVVRGSMEFGPRALCHTSTLAYPDPLIAKRINKMNNRVNEMPFGLVVTRDQAQELFCDTEKVHKSLEYMIITRQFKRGMTEFMEGGAHYYPISGIYTCRPQVTKDPMMVEILKATGPLINTSWNYHGTPIVRSTDEILYTHMHERRAYEDFVITLIEEELTK